MNNEGSRRITTTEEDIDKQAYLLMSNINAVKITTNIDDKHHETLMNSFLILMRMFSEYIKNETIEVYE